MKHQTITQAIANAILEYKNEVEDAGWLVDYEPHRHRPLHDGRHWNCAIRELKQSVDRYNLALTTIQSEWLRLGKHTANPLEGIVVATASARGILTAKRNRKVVGLLDEALQHVLAHVRP